MDGVATATVQQLRDAIADLYQRSDELLNGLTTEEWRKKHGGDWIMADVPYHLAYFDREVVANAIERGADVPDAERELLRTSRELDTWNDRMFAQRPPGQTVEQAREELRTVRERVRQLASSLTDADLGRPAWFSLGGLGQRTARTALAGCVMHNWSEHTQLRLRLGKDGPLPAPATTHLAFDGYMHFFPAALDTEAAKTQRFAARLSITGPGGGDWLFAVHDGGCDVSEDSTSKADLTMTMSPETFARMWNEMNNPMLLMLTRRIRLKGLRKMPAFGKLFPTPKPDTPAHPELVKL